MPKQKSAQQRLFYYQLFINSIVIFAYLFLFNRQSANLFLIVNIIGFLLYDRKISPSFDIFNHALQFLMQTTIIPQAFGYFVQLTQGLIPWRNPFLVILVILYSLVMFIPYTFMFIIPVKNTILRGLILIFSFIYTATGALDWMTVGTVLFTHPSIVLLSDTLFGAALIIVIIITFAMYKWGYGFPKISLARYARNPIIALIVVFSVWFALWNGFSSGNSLLASFFTFDFSMIKISPLNILNGVEAGIAEEYVFRFGVLTILLNALYNSRNRFLWASLISSVLFGLMHGLNIFAGQDVGNTIVQIIFAFSFGFYLAAVYLYSNLFFLPIIFHALLDIFAFVNSSGQIMTGNVSIATYIATVIEALVFIIIALLLIHAVKNRENGHLRLGHSKTARAI